MHYAGLRVRCYCIIRHGHAVTVYINGCHVYMLVVFVLTLFVTHIMPTCIITQRFVLTLKRRLPTGGAAYGTPKKRSTVSVTAPGNSAIRSR